MDSCPKYSPPTCSEPKDVVVTRRRREVSSAVPKDVEVNIDHLTATPSTSGDPGFSPRPCVKDASYSSTDEEEATVSAASFVLNDSDCDTVVTDTTTNSRRVGGRDPSSVTSAHSSGSVTSCSSTNKKIREKVNRMNEADVGEVDRMIIKEFQGMSVVDRGLVQEEIHGVSTCAVLESDEKIAEALKRLEEEIRAIRREILVSPIGESRVGNIYDDSIWSYLAVEEEGSSPSAATVNSRTRLLYSYIFHPAFRLKFLRADLFDVEKAAHRYLRCLEGLLKYFGSYALQRQIMYEDLGKECQDAAKSGYVQILPSRDRAGRLVVVSQPTLNDGPGNNMAMIIKLFTYIFSVVSEDIETQRRGVIFVFSTSEEALPLLQHPNDKMEYTMYREGSPVRRSCTHFCLPENNPKMKVVRAIMMLAMPREERIRIRIHMDGLTVETQYKLMTFGIPVSELPITSTGGIKTKHHLQWIRTRKALDASRMKSLEGCYNSKIRQRQEEEKEQRAAGTVPHTDFCVFPTYDEFLLYHGEEPIIHPMINDVLFSKGGKNVTHYGNIEFTDLMKRSLIRYVQGTPLQNRKMRKAIRQSIVDEVQARGGRFLTLDKKLRGGYCWTEIQEGPDLHDRIATSLYDHKRRLAAKLKVQKDRCGTAMFTESDKSKRRKIVNDDGEPTPDPACCSLNS
eukprot:CAMPEP_0172366190 /NCGR_PEP_ID=MMETSP1060-20121228/14061_1 /TAXON_ID=37318 /ORGANISM="Pseudo-nitzschia pungens, Strain cf. cingulata" /LENGTH=679 /DNA_ID=CAMNT_0013089933 /DNA_START=111 /DNA_END=2150 /DNA_ORIENTATION=+